MNPNKDRPAERMTLTKLGALVEAFRADIERVAESLSGLTSRVDSVDGRLARVERELDVLAPIIKSLAPVPNELRALAARLDIVESSK